jgi:hypothetical protein
MRKVMLLAAMLAMVLAAAAPALAQQIGGDQGPVAGDDAVQAGDNIQYAAVCQNILGALEAEANQAGFDSAQAFAGENAAAVSEVAQEQNVSVSQVNECLNVTAAAATAHAAAGAQYAAATGTATATATATAAATATATASPTALPPTGGPVPSSALALGAGALLVGGGLLARRIVR